jgi:hypothetical protein
VKNKDLLFLKLIAVSAALIYVYRAKQKGVSLGNMKVNPEKIANLAANFVPREFRGHARQLGSLAIKRIMK